MIQSIFTRPLFINPQAYSVIPELYNISKAAPLDFNERGSIDVYIVTSGKVEYKLLKAGKEVILHLDLYTVDGSCVLGEWYLNGISSDSINDIQINISNNKISLSYNSTQSSIMSSMVLWYDIAKQGCTNESMKADPTLKDFSGNGHDMTCYNFAWGGMSGIGGYDFQFSDINHSISSTGTFRATGTWNATKAHITAINNLGQFFENGGGKYPVGSMFPGYKVRLTGLDTLMGDNRLRYQKSNGDYVIFEKDGEYEIESEEVESLYKNGWSCLELTESCDFSIEILPLYPGALVFDDVDDYGVVIKRGDFEKCTMLMLCTPISKQFVANSILIDTRGNANNIFYINNYPADAIAFPGANVGNICINNIQNNVLTVQQLNYKKVLISRTGAISNEDSNPIYLGTNKYFNAYSGMALYKFLLFDRELTQEEIDKVIDYYSLMDDVDNIEVK